jgi:hypothetical protein
VGTIFAFLDLDQNFSFLDEHYLTSQDEERISKRPMMQNRMDRIRDKLDNDIGISSIQTFSRYFHEADKASIELGSEVYEDFELFENLGMIEQVFGLKMKSPSQICVEYVLTESGRFFLETLYTDRE